MSNFKLGPKIIVCPETSEFWFVFDWGFHVKKNSIEYFSNGSKCWCLNGKFHRKDGPAIEYSDGTRFWYLNGKELSEVLFEVRKSKQ